MNENTPDPAVVPDEEVKPAPPSSPEPKPDEQVEKPAEEAKAEEISEEKTEPEPDEEEPPRKKSGYARLKARHEALIAQLEAERQARQPGPEEPKEPKPEDFGGDYLAFEKASVAFAATKAIREELAKARQQDFQAREVAAQQDSIADFVEEAKSYSKRIPDYDQSIDQMYGSLGPLPNVLRDLISNADNGHMVLYQLAKNPGLARDLYNGAPLEVAMKVGGLDARLSLPSAKKETKAPPPITAPKGGASPPRDIYGLATKSEDIRDYVKARKAMKDTE
jgi:hypothetical protein